MYEPVQQCKACGAGLTLDDLRATGCRYCKTVFPHHAQAAQHAEMSALVMNQMMAQQAQVQNQWRAGFGAGPMPPPPGAPGSPYADPLRIAQAHRDSSAKLSRMIMIIVLVTVVVVLLLTAAIVVAAFVFR